VICRQEEKLKEEKEMEQEINVVPIGTDASVSTGATEQMSRNLVKKYIDILRFRRF